MIPRRGPRRNIAGVALLTAVGMLFLFSVLGVTFIAFMTTEVEGARLEVAHIRARQAARAGVQAALGEIQDALAANRAPRDLLQVPVPVYAASKTAATGLRVRDDMRAYAEATIVVEAPDKFKVTGKGVCGKVAPGGELYHTTTVGTDAQAVIVDGKPRIAFWSEHDGP